MKRRREWSALLAGVMALGVLGGGISVSADEDVPTIVIYNNSGAFSVAGAEAGSDSSIYQKMQDYILEQTDRLLALQNRRAQEDRTQNN